MPKPKILHMISPSAHVSPFDVNMAADAGYEIIFPHCNVDVSDVAGLVQDSIFSRPPKSAASSGMFISGYDVNIAADMLRAAKKAMVPPFELSVFADPNGAFTTSASLVAVIESCLREHKGMSLEGQTVKILGGGPVGICVAVLATQRGASVSLVRLTPSARQASVDEFIQRFDVEIESERAVENSERIQAIGNAQILISTAKAGIQILDRSALEHATSLLVAADVNAVPPTGIEGVGVMDNKAEVQTGWGSFYSIGALGVGSVKYKVQHNIFKQMLESNDALVVGLSDAYSAAVAHVG